MGTVIDDKQRRNVDRHQPWDRLPRAELLGQYCDLQAQGLSQRQAALRLAVPRTTLQAWRAWQERLEACPQVVEFFESVPGLACLHRLVLAFHVVGVDIGACGIRLVCLLVELMGLNRFVGASYGEHGEAGFPLPRAPRGQVEASGCWAVAVRSRRPSSHRPGGGRPELPRAILELDR